MSITEMKTAIQNLPASEVGELMTWLTRYHEQTRKTPLAADAEQDPFDSLISEAYASGTPSPLTKSDIGKARRMVKERIAERNAGK